MPYHEYKTPLKINLQGSQKYDFKDKAFVTESKCQITKIKLFIVTAHREIKHTRKPNREKS